MIHVFLRQLLNVERLLDFPLSMEPPGSGGRLYSTSKEEFNPEVRGPLSRNLVPPLDDGLLYHTCESMRIVSP